eukprot:COSAG06_NODE_239_length_19404_cov_12.723284_13_plen_58_part_00
MASSLEDLFAAREDGESGTQAATWADPARAGGYGWGQVKTPAPASFAFRAVTSMTHA